MRATFIILMLLVVGSSACGPPSGTTSGNDSTATGSPDSLELTKEIIDERINGARVYDVMPENGTGNPIPWSFDEDEPKEIVVVDQKVDGTRATVVLDIKTQSSPRSSMMRQLSGQIRTDWQLRTGWVLRRWEIDSTENISMKYRDIPKATNSNTNSNQSTPNKTSIVN